MLKDLAICLRVFDYSESSQVAVLLSRHYGKVSTLAKGSRRRHASALAKFAGGLDLLGEGEAVWIPRPQTALAQLVEWDPDVSHPHLHNSTQAWRWGCYAADLLHHLVQDHDPHPGAHRAMTELLRALGDPAGRELALLRFQWAVVVEMGYRPILDHDAETRQPLEERGGAFAFSPSAGGLVASEGPGRWRVRAATVQALRKVADGTLDPNGAPQTLRRANQLLAAYLRAILDEHLPTMDGLLGRSLRHLRWVGGPRRRTRG